MEGTKRATRAAGVFLFVFFYGLTAAYAATEHLPPGFLSIKADVNGDRRDDVILQPRTAEREASLLLGIGDDVPAMFWQRLNDIDPELAWDEARAALVIADFNGDERDDIYVQGRAPGNLQAMLTANPDGSFTTTTQKFSGEYMGFDWAAKLRNARAGDFDGDGRDELLMQGAHADDVHPIIRPNAEGILNSSGPAWIDGYLDLRWNANDAELHVGDFNGDGRDDLLWRRLAKTVSGEPAVAFLAADANGEFTEITQEWDKDFLGAEWDPATHDIRIGDINGDGIADIVLMSRNGGTHYLVPGRYDGRFLEVTMQWQGDKSAEQAWLKQPGGVADVVINADQTMTRESASSTSDASTKAPGVNEKTSVVIGNSAVGTLPGDFSVDPTGAANYRIPIEVPPGVGGMQPDLAFMYSSRAGNGLLGVGWSLSGLSAISRCPASVAQTGSSFVPVRYSKDDKFCLDGQLLNKVNASQTYGASGTLYGTEVASFQRVESKGGNVSTDPAVYTGPDHFIVKDKAGLIREYGNTTGSRIKIEGKVVTKLWALNRIRDRFGNYIKFEYEQGTQVYDGAPAGTMHAYWPKRISWHNRHDVLIGKVELEYDDRPDVTAGYEPLNEDPAVRGSSLFKRLSNAIVYSRNVAVRDYRIVYEQLRPSDLSAIKSMTLCDANASCVPPTSFTWSRSEDEEGELVYGLDLPASSVVDSAMNSLGLDYMKLGDANGDGRTDIFAFDSNDGELYVKDLAVSGRTNTGVFPDGGYYYSMSVVMDYNRDGRDDLLMASDGLFPVWHVATSSASGTWTVQSTGVPASGFDSNPVPVDVNGDGYPELVFMENGHVKFLWNSPDGFQGSPTTVVPMQPTTFGGEQRMYPMEINGDGLADIYISRDSAGSHPARVLLSTGTTFEVNNSGPQSEKVHAFDSNGDGLTDLAVKGNPFTPETSHEGTWYLYINSGNWFYPAGTVGGGDNDKAAVIDWNRDGRPELMYSSEYTGQWAAGNETVDLDSDVEVVVPLEYNGDTLADILYYHGNWKYRKGNGEAAGLLTHVINGLGDEQEVRYWYLNRKTNAYSDVYLGHTSQEVGLTYYGIDSATQLRLNNGTASFMKAPIPVVSSIETDTGVEINDLEGRIATTYRYAGAVMDMTGRGFLGFRMMKVRNHNTGIETVNLHHQTFPYTGMVEKALQKVPDTHTIETVRRTGGHASCEDLYSDPLTGSCGFVVFDESTTEGRKVSETTSTFDSVAVDGGVFPFVATTIEKQYQYPAPAGDPPLQRVVESTFTYGTTVSGKVTGDPTTITVETSTDGTSDNLHRVTTSNQYADNDVDADWCLGRLTSSTVTHYRAEDGASEVKQATFDYDSTVRYGTEKSCRLNQEVSDSNDLSVKVQKDHSFDDFGNITQTSVTADGETRNTAQVYDQYGLFPRFTQNAMEHREYYIWDHRFGAKRASTGPNGLTTFRDYDSFGRLVKEIAPRTAVTGTHKYEWCKSYPNGCISESAEYVTEVTSSVTPDAPIVTEFDSLQRKVASRTADMQGRTVVEETIYDSLGRPYLVSLPYFSDMSLGSRCWNHTVYDLLGRPKQTGQPLNQAECDTHGVILESATATPYAKRLNYDYLGITTPTGMTTRGFTTVVTDQSGRAKTTVKNVLDRVLGVKENDGSSDIATYFGYDVLGNTTTVQPPDGGAVTMSYDTAGRKTSMIDPDMGTWTYDYTGFGELQWQIDAVGNRVDMVYDKLGRMVSRTDTPDAGAVKTTAWVYDNAYGAGVGKLAHVANADGYAETYAYNEYGQATDTVRLADGEVYWTSQTYDAEGRPDILVYPDVATFDTDASAPAAVTLTVPANNTGEVGITWTRDNPFATYRLYRSTSSSGYDESVPVYLGPLNAFTDTVSENGTYYYWVDACHGDVCTETGPASTITLLPPPAPAFLDVENYDAENDGSVSLSWGASVGQDNYIIRRAGSLNGTYTDIAAPTGTSTTLSLAEDEHYFQVVACRGSSCSAPTPGDSSAVVHYRPGLLPAPTFTTTFVHNVTGVEDDAVTIDGAAAVDVHAPADPFVQFHEIDVYRYGLLIDTRRFFDGLSDPLEVSGLPNGEIHFKARACKISNADSLCGPDSAASTTLLAGTRPSQFPSLSAITPQSTKTFTLSFGNPENIKSGGPYQVWLQEARDAGFEETSAPVAVPNGSFETCEDTESPTGEDPSPPTCTIHSAPPTSVEVTTASNGKYWYGLYACHETFGCSSPREFGPVDIHTVPSKPVSITSNGSIDGTDWLIASDESFIISWAGSSDTVDRYQFEQRMLPASDYTEVALAADTATSKTYSGKAPGQYFYRVKACYAGLCSGYIETSQYVWVEHRPTTPTGLSAAANVSEVWIGWNPSDYMEQYFGESGSKYIVQYDDNAAFSSPGSALISPHCEPPPGYNCEPQYYTLASNWKHQGAAEGTWYYRVKARNPFGDSGFSAAASAGVWYTPGSPTGLTHTNRSSSGSYSVSWYAAASNGASSVVYHLQESKNGGGWVDVVRATGSTSVGISGRGNGDYRYRVRACNGNSLNTCSGMVGPLNHILEVRHAPGTPSSISNPYEVTSGSSYTVSWGASSGAVSHYQLQSSLNGSSWSTIYTGTGRSKSMTAGQAGDIIRFRVRGCYDWACSGFRTSGYTRFKASSGGGGCGLQCTNPDSTDPDEPVLMGTPGGETVSTHGVNGKVHEKRFESSHDVFDVEPLSIAVADATSSLASQETTAAERVDIEARASDVARMKRASRAGIRESHDLREHAASTSANDALFAATVNYAAATVGWGEHSEPLHTIAMSSRAGNQQEPAATPIIKTSQSARSRNDFRAMPPMRPADFYRDLRVGSPAVANDGRHPRTARPTTRPGNSTDGGIVKTGLKSSQVLVLSPSAAARLKQDTDDDAASTSEDETFLAPVVPLRNDPRIRRTMSSDTTTSSKTGTVGTLKFGGVTNEPAGTYAHAVQHVYHPITGQLENVRECVANASDTGCDETAGQTYWTARDVDVNGAITRSSLGNGLATQRAFNRFTGTLGSITTGLDNGSGGVSSATVQNLEYQWDIFGNVIRRKDLDFEAAGSNVFEQEFQYDALNRLTYSKSVYNITGLNPDERSNRYQKSGNIACFNVDSGSTCSTTSPDYTYDGSKHHAVQLKSGSGGSTTPYVYNNNGSMIAGPDRAITWTAFNKPGRIDNTASGAYSEFAYDVARSRYRHTQGSVDAGSIDTVNRVTTYIGGLYERVEASGTTTHRFHIFAGGGAVALYSCTTDCGSDPEGNAADGTKDETLYFHKDHLGSINVITDGHGTELERITYTAWGGQQKWDATANGGTGDYVSATSQKQTRGFTGHEMLNELGLIHMNGRIYDQNIGRFISADPFVQFPHSTQGYNRYTYVGNNPLRYTDPSGYFWEGFGEALGKAIGHVGPILSIGCTAWYAVCAGASAAVSGYLQGASTFDAVWSGMRTAAVAYLGQQAAGAIGNQGYKHFGASLYHGVAQGALSRAGGGRFGDGFLGGFSSHMLGPVYEKLSPDASTMIAAIVGGTLAEIGGGRFANGAMSAALVHAFNFLKHEGARGIKHEYEEVDIRMGIEVSEGLSSTSAKLTVGSKDGDIRVDTEAPSLPDSVRSAADRILPTPRSDGSISASVPGSPVSVDLTPNSISVKGCAEACIGPILEVDGDALNRNLQKSSELRVIRTDGGTKFQSVTNDVFEFFKQVSGTELYGD